MLSSFRTLLLAAAVMAVALAACGAPGADDVDASGGAQLPDGPGDGGPEATAREGTASGDVQRDRDRPPDEDPAARSGDAAGSDDEGAAADETGHAPAPEPAAAFELSPDEMLPNAKRLAADVVQTVLSYEPEDTPGEIAGRVAGDDRAPALVVSAAPLLHADAWSRGEIVYPQLGGFTDAAASVMVVARQTIGLPNGEVRDETRTLDVRLAVEDGEWVFDALASAGGRVTERPDDLTDAAIAVVDDDRIELPDTARWDIYRGVIEEPMLELMALIAERTEYGVVVLDTGHPWEVFGTDRQSRHSLGRAVDLYRLSGPDIIDDREHGSETHEFMQWLYDRPEMTNMGGPWSLDDFGGRSFTDDLHQDHLHIESAAGD